MTGAVFTIGHSTRSIEDFANILRSAAVSLVVDVRTVPRSRTNPQYNEDALGQNLEPWQIGYRRIAELGGLRGKSRDVPPELNAIWRNQSFHNYAYHALSAAFDAGLGQLLEASAERPTAIMCSEAVWWRCHRRIIADWLIARGESVFHLMGEARIEPATLSPGARVADRQVTYPGRESS